MAEDTASDNRENRKGPLAVLFLVVFLDLVGFGILIPQLGVYGVKFQASPFVVGMLLAVYSLMQLIFAPVLGRLSDRYGRRPVLLYSIAGSAVGYVLFGLATSLTLLFIGRIVHGIAGGNIATAQAYVADVTTAEGRTKGMGIIGAGFGLGFVFGPAIGGIAGSTWENAGIGFTAAGLAVVNWVLAFFLLPESRRPNAARAEGKSLARLGQSLRLPVVGSALVLFLVYITAFAQMEGTFSVFLVQLLSEAPLQLSGSLWEVKAAVEPALTREASSKAGWIFVMIGVVSALIQGGLIGRLRKRVREPALIVTGCILVGGGLLAVPFAPGYAWLFVPMGALAAGSALVQPSLSATVSLAAPAERQGEVLGAYQGMGALGRIAGPLLGGLFFSTAGAAAPYWTAAAMMAVCVGLALRLRSQVQNGGANP